MKNCDICRHRLNYVYSVHLDPCRDCLKTNSRRRFELMPPKTGKECDRCLGSGKIICQTDCGLQLSTRDCPDCNGTGKATL